MMQYSDIYWNCETFESLFYIGEYNFPDERRNRSSWHTEQFAVVG